jgi:hypothetical protein
MIVTNIKQNEEDKRFDHILGLNETVSKSLS